MSNRFKIVTSRLLLAHVRCETRIPGRSRQILSLDEWNVLALGVFVAFRETEVNNVNIIFGHFSASNKEVIRFNISVNDSLLVHFLDSFDHLLGNKAARLEVELALALHKEVLETWTEHIHHHHVELVLFVCLVCPDVIK